VPVPLRILIVGSGAREHALALALSGPDRAILAAPGNLGTALVGRNAPVRADDVPGLVDLARHEHTDLVVVGPELPLTLGLVDALTEARIPAFGPTRAAARLEGSKVFMKELLARAKVPTADFATFDDPALAEAHVRAAHRPLVVKADGLAAGKGVVVAGTQEEALEAVDRMMRRREFGDAGQLVVIEDFLPGEEASFHVVCDGTRAVPLAAAQDHKRVADGDRGPNTGGMGAYAPAPLVTPEVRERVMRTLIEPVLETLAREGMPFRGVLFAGLMIEDGTPRILEFNVRFGDPETAVIAPLYGGDWFALLEGAARGRLGDTPLDRATLPSPDAEAAALCVVMAAAGYPGTPRAGDPIAGLDLPREPGAFVLHAGTQKRVDGAVVTSGGRVLTVGARAPTLALAARRAYATVGQLHWDGEHHRSDIGRRALLAMPAEPR
jgi:phosphoribosylamine--glycine ligase